MQPSLTVASALAWAAMQLGEQRRRDADLLLRHATGWDRAFLLAHGEAQLTEEAEAAFRRAILRRATGEPVQYITGMQEFWGLEFHVTPAVLIPRPETEHLIEAVLARTSPERDVRIADVGTGSGAIAIALATELTRARIVATDISREALQIASGNAERHAVAERIRFVECDLLPYDLPGLDFVVSNPPYIAEADRESLAIEVKDFEPAAALFAGDAGLDIYRRLVPAAWQALKPGGWLVMELGAGQAPSVAQMLTGWHDIQTTQDLQGIPRVVSARKVR
jgi:release factor glutamine methyltransferase